MFRYLPEQASEIAPKVDWINNWITDISVFFTVAIVGSMLYFAIRYRKKGDTNHETPQILGSHFFEMIWTVVPTLICIFIAWEGISIFREMRTAPKDALVVEARGSQWRWDFEYENGKRTTGDFVLPVNKSVKILLTSTDVLHSFYLPSMRVKQDAIKGEYSFVTFKPVKTGEYRLFCAEYCGKDHWNMLGKLRVVSEDEYKRWVSDKSEPKVSPIERGKILYEQKGCKACHSLTGTRLVGPSWLKLFGREETLTDGSKVLADENYLRESILKPNVKIVQGFAPNMMPAFEGQLSEPEVAGLIAFIRSLDGSGPVEAAAPVAAEVAVDLTKLTPAERGKMIYEGGKNGGPACKTCHTLDGSRLVGPSFKGIYGRSAKWADGTAYTVTDDYIKESIYAPMAHIVEGYAPGMIPYQGVLKDDDVKDVIEFLKTVK